jgi:hypothetical protein
MHRIKEGVILKILVKESLNLELWLKSYEGLNFQGFSEIFPRKIGKLDFLELILHGKIRGLGPQGCGPRRPGPLWTGSHCREPELIGARPPAPPVVEVAGRGVEEEEGSTGLPVPVSPGLGRRRSNTAMTVKVAVEERSVLACSGRRERGRSGGGGVMRRGGVGRPFIGSEGERGGRASEGNGRWRWWPSGAITPGSKDGIITPGGKDGVRFGEERGRTGKRPGVVAHWRSGARWRRRPARGR